MAKKNRTKTTKETQLLKVPLTDQELLSAGQRLADQVRQQVILEGEAKSIASQYKAKIDEVKAKIASTQALIHDKYEYRKVPCVNVLDYTAVTSTTTRLDTGEIIDTHKMTEDEQSNLPFDDEKAEQSESQDESDQT